MNIYRTEFFAACPTNGLRIKYALRIDSAATIKAEDILAAIGRLPAQVFHEDAADALARALPGHHVLSAHHHGVDIESRRGGQ